MADEYDERKSSGTRRRRSSSHSAVAESPASPLVQGLLLGVLCLIILWAPIPLGSNRPFYLSLLGVLTGVTLVAWGVAAFAGLIKPTRRIAALWPAGLALAVALAFALFQTIDLKAVDQMVGTTLARDLGHPIWQLAGESLGQSLPSYVTVDPAKANAAFARTFVYAAVFFLAFVLARQSGSAKVILTVVCLSGALCVAAGFLQGALGVNIGGALADEVVLEAGPRFSSTFVNPNNFATFSGIALISALGLLHAELTRGLVLNRGRDIAFRTTLSTFLGPALPGLASALLLIGAVILSGSRAATLAVLAGVSVWAAIMFLGSRSGQGRDASPVSMLLIAVFLIGGAALASATLMFRIDTAGVGDEMRSRITDITIDAAFASPWLGNGFGAFPQYYPLYAQDGGNYMVNAAHNDFLEVFSDLGFIGGAAFLFAPAYLAFLAARGAFRRQKSKYFGAVAMGAAALCATHALFDFSLQIPAVGVLLYAVLGVGVAQAWRGEDEAGGDQRMSA
jgi:O-antigen ligase